MRTFASDRWRRFVQGDSSGRNSKGLPYSWRDSSLDRARRSMTGVVRRLDSRETSRRSEQCLSSTVSNGRVLREATQVEMTEKVRTCSSWRNVLDPTAVCKADPGDQGSKRNVTLPHGLRLNSLDVQQPKYSCCIILKLEDDRCSMVGCAAYVRMQPVCA